MKRRFSMKEKEKKGAHGEGSLFMGNHFMDGAYKRKLGVREKGPVLFKRGASKRCYQPREKQGPVMKDGRKKPPRGGRSLFSERKKGRRCK